MYSFVSVVISGLVLSLIYVLEKLSTHVILLLGYLAILPCVSAMPNSATQDFPHIPFKLFNEFIQENFSSKISLATVLTILFSLVENPDLLNLHFRRINPIPGEYQKNDSNWMSIFSQKIIEHLDDGLAHLFQKHTCPVTDAETELSVSKKLTAMAEILNLSPYDGDGDFRGKVLPTSYSKIDPIRILCPSNMVCISSSCPRSGRSLLRSGKIEDIPNVTLIKNTTVYKNVAILSALCPACDTTYHVDHDIVRSPSGGRAQVYLNSASYLKIGRRIWVDRIFSSSVLKGMYSFHASATAYMDFWNLSYAFNNSASSFIISRRHIWQAFIQESIRSVASVSETNLILSPHATIYEVAREAFTYLGDGGIIRVADGHSCGECAQPYKKTADAIHHNNPTAVLEDNELPLPASVQQPPASSNSNANQSLVKMIVLDGIVMGPTVCFIFVLSVNIILIFYFSIVHLMVAYKT